jgi:3-deoxy-D-manno-octulosonate 8-phosphate phosphatase (KDO 8-P phosphatase)
MSSETSITPTTFVLDVDGVMTSGQFIYSSEGKQFKIFGPHDSDGLKMISQFVKIQFITADKRGYDITKRRIVDDMGYELELVSESQRSKFFQDNYDLSKTVFMGDGYFDAEVLRNCALGIAPKNARVEALSAADYVTPSESAKGAVMDACIYLMERFFDFE